MLGKVLPGEQHPSPQVMIFFSRSFSALDFITTSSSVSHRGLTRAALKTCLKAPELMLRLE